METFHIMFTITEPIEYHQILSAVSIVNNDNYVHCILYECVLVYATIFVMSAK